MVDSPRFLSLKTIKIGAKRQVEENGGQPGVMKKYFAGVYLKLDQQHLKGNMPYKIQIELRTDNALFSANGEQPGSVSHSFDVDVWGQNRLRVVRI